MKNIRNLLLFSALILCCICSFAAAKSTFKDDLAALSDEFGDPATLSAWFNLDKVEKWPERIEHLDINQTSPGHLYLVPYTSAWYGDYRGVFLFKKISGDFIITTRLAVTGKKRDIPENIWALGGIMARIPRDITMETWTPGGENWVYCAAGTGPDPESWSLDARLNIKSRFEYRLKKGRKGWILLRMIRVGPMFVGMYRFENESWMILERFKPLDLPSTLQLGIFVSADAAKSFETSVQEFNTVSFTGGKPDLIARFDYVRFARPRLDKKIKEKILAGKFDVLTDKQLIKMFSN